MLDSNIHQAYLLVLGYCTNLIQIKPNQQTQWAQISPEQNTITLLEVIKTVTFSFEDQNFLPLDLYQSKSNIYVFRQDDMTNKYYLKRFNTLVDITEAYNGYLYDQAIINIFSEWKHPGVDYSTPNTDQNRVLQKSSSELYLATIFITQRCRRWYINLSKELENSFTKGNDD